MQPTPPPAAGAADQVVLVLARNHSLGRSRGCRDHLAKVTDQHAADFRPDAPARWRADRVVFFGDRLAAVLRRGDDGRAVVIRFDV